MFWTIFISWWYLLYVLSLVFRGVGTGYVNGSGKEEGLVYHLTNYTMWTCSAMVPIALIYKVVPWWAAIVMFPIGWLLAFLIRMLMTPVLLPLASSKSSAAIFSVVSFSLSLLSFYLFLKVDLDRW